MSLLRSVPLLPLFVVLYQEVFVSSSPLDVVQNLKKYYYKIENKLTDMNQKPLEKPAQVLNQENTADPEGSLSQENNSSSPIYSRTSSSFSTTAIPSRIQQSLTIDDGKEVRFDYLSKNWAEKLNSLNDNQRLFAEKLINDVLYDAELEFLGIHTRLANDNPYYASFHREVRPNYNLLSGQVQDTVLRAPEQNFVDYQYRHIAQPQIF